jgi:hypothetical protein
MDNEQRTRSDVVGWGMAAENATIAAKRKGGAEAPPWNVCGTGFSNSFVKLSNAPMKSLA